MTQNIFIAIIIAMAAALGLLALDRYSLVKKNEGLISQVASREEAIKNLWADSEAKNQTIIKQNKDIDGLVDEAKFRANEAYKAVQQAKKDANENMKRSQELLLAKRKTDNACKDAEELINGYLGFK